jgi:hypothetical protein
MLTHTSGLEHFLELLDVLLTALLLVNNAIADWCGWAPQGSSFVHEPNPAGQAALESSSCDQL